MGALEMLQHLQDKLGSLGQVPALRALGCLIADSSLIL
jgi:hypothetical protein